jgi:transposase
MSTDVPLPGKSSRPLRVSVDPAAGILVAPTEDPFSAALRVSVVQVPVSQLVDEAKVAFPASTPPTSSTQALNTAALPDDTVVLKQMIDELLQALRRERHDREAVQQQLDALMQRLYGPRPAPTNPDQGLLFPDESLPAPPPPPEEKSSGRRGQSKPHGRRRPPRDLRREPRRYELTMAERLCPECGTARQEIGVETTSQYEYKRPEVFVIEHQRVKYACKCCQGQVAIAPKPPQPLAKGLPGAGLLAQILVDKYQDHLPLHRTEQRFARCGVSLPRSTMCDWMAACAEALTPLCHTLKQWVLQSKVLHTDDTTVPVRDEKLSNHRCGRLWDYIGDHDHPGIVFDYTTTHARDGPAAFLKGFRGFLQADAFSGYDGIYTGSGGTIVEVGCWAPRAQQVQGSAKHRPRTRGGRQSLGPPTLRRRG